MHGVLPGQMDAINRINHPDEQVQSNTSQEIAKTGASTQLVVLNQIRDFAEQRARNTFGEAINVRPFANRDSGCRNFLGGLVVLVLAGSLGATYIALSIVNGKPIVFTHF
jgi:hypothetical protein